MSVRNDTYVELRNLGRRRERRQQVLVCEWFLDQVFDTGLARRIPRRVVEARRHQDHMKMPRFGVEGPCGLDTVKPRHMEIHQHIRVINPIQARQERVARIAKFRLVSPR